MLKREDISEATERRFWAKVRKTGHKSRCWVWGGGANSQGYGCIGWGRRGAMKYYLAHRVSFVLAGGALDDNLTIDHTCGRRRCVNPKHLEQVTRAENNRRIHFRPRATKPGSSGVEGHTGDISAACTPDEVRKVLYSLASPPGFEPGSPT